MFKRVQIGNQVWMSENLNLAIDSSDCYGGDPANCEKYGRLYTLEAAKEASEMIHGWHLPTDEDCDILINHLGNDAGTKLKTGGSSGFNAILCGYRDSSGDFFYLDLGGFFWLA